MKGSYSHSLGATTFDAVWPRYLTALPSNCYRKTMYL